jgi:hypothetical protein
MRQRHSTPQPFLSILTLRPHPYSRALRGFQRAVATFLYVSLGRIQHNVLKHPSNGIFKVVSTLCFKTPLERVLKLFQHNEASTSLKVNKAQLVMAG